MRQHLDIGGWSVLAVCDCGWRGGIQTTRISAWREAHDHVLACHPGEVSSANWSYRLGDNRG